jgi:DNA-binding transcriptional LysR family regulator
MELRQLRYLVALADEGSFTRAAEQAHVAQPALSRQIQKLERELGLPLVDRTTHRVTLTAAGHEAVTAARRALGELEALKHSLHQTMNLLQGSVTIGVTQTPGPMDIPRELAAFSHRHARVDLVVREGLSVRLAGELRQDRLDIAVVSGIDQRERDQLVFESCRAERLVALLPSGHSLASRRQLRVADLRGERFVTFLPGATIRQTVERAAASAGFHPRSSIETNDVGRTIALVAEGLGVAVLPETDARRGETDTVAIPLRAPTMRYEILIAWRARRHLSPAAEALRSHLLRARQ